MPGSANGFITVRLPDNDIGNYVNLTLAFEERPRFPELTACSIGKIKIPHIILSKTLPLIHQLFLNQPDYRDFWNHTETIEQALFKEKTMIVQYQFTPKRLEQIKQTGRELLLSDTEQERPSSRSMQRPQSAWPFCETDCRDRVCCRAIVVLGTGGNG